MSDRKLLLLDGLNVVRRVYEANPAPDSADKAQAAVKSSLGSFRRAFTEHQPDYALCVFDVPGRTWRHELHEGYKASRKPMPGELRAVLPQVEHGLRELGCTSCAIPGVEADDVITSVGLRWVELALGEVTVLSTDKDLAALLPFGVKLRDHFTPEWRDADWVRRKFAVEPEQLQDYLALVGDSSDDIPGVDKVGPKTAAKLLKEHHTLEGVLAWAQRGAGTLAQRLREHEASARLSRELVTLRTNVEARLTSAQLRFGA